MNSHPEELELARAYRREQPFEELTQQQVNQIMDRGRALHKWFKTHDAWWDTHGDHLLIMLTMRHPRTPDKLPEPTICSLDFCSLAG